MQLQKPPLPTPHIPCPHPRTRVTHLIGIVETESLLLAEAFWAPSATEGMVDLPSATGMNVGTVGTVQLRLLGSKCNVEVK